MAAFTSKATGNWNAAGQTTWNEVGTPGVGDTTQIQNTHHVSMTQNEACDAFVVDTGGTITDAGFELDVGGTIDVVNGGTANFTGKTIMSGAGDLRNPRGSDLFAELELSAGITATLIGTVQSAKYTIGNCTINGAPNILNCKPAANNAYSQHATASVNVPVTFALDADGTTHAGNVDTSEVIKIIDIAADDRTITFSGNVTSADVLTIQTTENTHYTKLVMTVGDLTTAGLVLGGAGADKGGQLELGSGTHVISGAVAEAAGSTSANNSINFGSGQTSFGNDVDFTDITVTPGTAAIIFAASAGVRILTMDGQSLYDVDVDNNGVTSFTLQDALICTNSFKTTAGKFTDAGFQLTVGGTIDIAAGSDCTFTGLTLMDGSGNLVNPSASDLFKELQTADGITATMTGNVYSEKYTWGNTTVNGGAGTIIWHMEANNTWSQHAGATISRPITPSFQTTGTTHVGNMSTTSWINFSSSAGANRDVTFSGNITAGNGMTLRNSTGGQWNKLIMNGGDITLLDMALGSGGGGGKLELGTGTHVFTDYVKQQAGGTSPDNSIDWGSGQTSIGGDLDMTNVTSVPGTAEVIFNASAGTPELTMDSQSLYKMTVNNAGVATFILQDALGVDNDFTVTAGKFDDNVQTVNVGGSIVLAGTVDLTGIWNLDGVGAQNITCAGKTLGVVVVNKAAGTVQLQDTASFISLAGTAGTFDFNGQDLTTTGGWSCNPDFQFVGAGFNGSAIVIGGNLNLAGSGITTLDLEAGAGWTLDVTGTAIVGIANVKNSDASGGTRITAGSATDKGLNTNWDFVVAPRIKTIWFDINKHLSLGP